MPFAKQFNLHLSTQYVIILRIIFISINWSYSMLAWSYRWAVAYRFLVAFVMGYACTSLFMLVLLKVFQHFLAQAESVYLSAFIAIIFYAVFVLSSFCIHSLFKLSSVALILCTSFFLASKFIG